MIVNNGGITIAKPRRTARRNGRECFSPCFESFPLDASDIGVCYGWRNSGFIILASLDSGCAGHDGYFDTRRTALLTHLCHFTGSGTGRHHVVYQ